MAKVLITAYAAVAVCFLRAYLERLTATGVIASLLWPVSLAIGLVWPMGLDDERSALSYPSMRSGSAERAGYGDSDVSLLTD